MTRTSSSLSVCGLVVLVLLIALPLTVSAQHATPTTPSGKVLRIHRGEFPITLDSQRLEDNQSIMTVGLDYEGLTRLDEKLNTVPGAAESWEFSTDGTVLTFHLREDLTYSDGSPLTAERFVYAIARACDPTLQAFTVSLIFAISGCEALVHSLDVGAATPMATPDPEAAAAYEAARANLGVKAIDDRTLEIHLDYPAAYFPTIAATWLFHPVQQEIIERDPEDWWRDPANRIGNGPFRASLIDAEMPDQRIDFVANVRYWAGRPMLDGITYVFFEDDAAALAAYTRGELDIAFPPYPWGSQPEIADDPVLSRELLRYPLAQTIHFGFDLNQEPFQDKKVRAAMAYGFDREAYCREIGHGSCVPTLSWIPPGVPGHIETDAFAFDPEKARQALAESSYGAPENLPPITYRYYVGEGDEVSRDVSNWLAENYRSSLGIELNLVPTTDEEWEALDATGETLQVTWWDWSQDYPDPQNWLSTNWTCDSPIYAEKYGYCNPAFDALIEQADRETDPTKRLALYEEAGKVLVADAPTVFAFNGTMAVLVKPYVTGYVTTPSDFWPGWLSLLTLDLAPHAEATPVA